MEYARVDPAKVMEVEACGECHVSAYEVWKTTPHATTFKTMHRKERAETIAGKLGFGLIKRDAFCFSCHYTPVLKSGSIRVVSGVSCESCHGAGADWIEVHNDYGAGATYQTESAAHREERERRSRAGGMRRPSDLYDVAANCFGCHSVPDERLVNVGGHSTGSAGFELVEWSQGEIRHNFLDSFKRGEIGPNLERTTERKRVMYVAGRALDLEYSLRGAAVAEGEGVYAKAMARRVRSAAAELRAIDGASGIREVGSMLAVVKGVRVGPGNRTTLLAAADAVERETRAFLARADTSVGGRLAALDPLLAGEDLAQLAAVDEPDPGAPPVTADEAQRGSQPDGSAPSRPTATASQAPAADTRARATTPAARSTSTATVEGSFKRRVHPQSDHRTLGSNACSGCHEEQNTSWFSHAHYRSADPFFDGENKNVQIARLYGVKTGEMTKGSQICMDCHGTVVSGKEARDVLDGVSCESCHGPAADWLEPHKDETDKELGRNRPGYQAALERGKNRLDNLARRAEICSGCHYITEPRLLSAGHPSGASFDYVGGMNEVRHWAETRPSSEINSAFESRLAARGAVPNVRVASIGTAPADSGPSERPGGGASAVPRPTSSRSTPTSTRQATVREGRAVARRQATGLRPPAPRPVRSTPTFDVDLPATVAGGIDLPPFPEIDGSTSIEEVLLQLKNRLELLYRETGPRREDDR